MMMISEEIKKELEVLLYELEDTENKFGWLMVKDKIWQCFESKLKSEIEQAEIRGWNKCYRTYIEDNDDDTALTNRQEIAEACKKAKIEENEYWLDFRNKDWTNLIHTTSLQNRIKELKEKL